MPVGGVLGLKVSNSILSVNKVRCEATRWSKAKSMETVVEMGGFVVNELINYWPSWGRPRIAYTRVCVLKSDYQPGRGLAIYLPAA